MLGSCLAMSLEAQTTSGTNGLVRLLSREECIRLALQHNLEIQLQRYYPTIRRFELNESYGIYYDPVFSAQVDHNSRITESTAFDPVTTLPLRSTEIDSDELSGGIRGQLPTGLSYDIGSAFSRQEGTAGGSDVESYDADIGVFQLRQPLLRNFWTDAGRTSIKVAKKNLKISQHDLEFKVMDVLTRVLVAYFSLIEAGDNVKVQQKALEAAEQLVTETKRKIQVGIEAPLEEKRVEADAARIRSDLILARQNRDTRENTLKDLITDNYEAWHQAAIEPTERLVALPESYNLGASWMRGLTLRPDFNSLKQQLERQGYYVRLAHNQLFPSLDAFGSYGLTGLDSLAPANPNPSLGSTLEDITDRRNPHYSVGLILSVPLSSKAERNRHKAAKETRRQLETLLKQKEQTIVIEIDNAVSAAQYAFQRVGETRAQRTFAEEALKAEQKKLDNGKSTPFLVLQAQRDLTAAEGAEVRALAEYNRALAELYFKEGTVLERNKITVDIK
jgi:outer membrane protein TolC